MDKEILNYIKEGIDTRPRLLEYFPSSTLIFHINNLKTKGYITKQTDNKSAKYAITNDGIKYLKTMKVFSQDKKIDPKETIEFLETEFRKQIIFPDDTVKDIFMTIPFCAGKYGRNTIGLLADIIGDYGRGKTIISNIYNEIIPEGRFGYVDCRDIYGERGIENTFRKITTSNPHIFVVDEFGNLRGVKLRALLKYIEQNDYPVILLGNPSGVKADWQKDTFVGWMETALKDDTQTAHSFLNRIHIFGYMPPLKPNERKRLARIIFDTEIGDLTDVGIFLQQQRKKSIKPSKDGWTALDSILDKVSDQITSDKDMTTDRTIETRIHGSLHVEHTKENLNLEWFFGGKSGTRFQMALISLARGRAAIENSDVILPEHFEKAFDMKCHFLKQIYKIDMRKKVGL